MTDSMYKSEEYSPSPTDTHSLSESIPDLYLSTGYCSSLSSAPHTPEPESVKVIKATPPKKQYQCAQCLKFFSRPSALQTHSYTHTAEKPFQCSKPNCGRNFSVVSNLRRHFKVHQKPSVGNKLSSEDRLRYVRQLMKTSEVILAKQKQIGNEQISLDRRSSFESREGNKYPSLAVQDSENHSYQHYLLSPAIENNSYDANVNTQLNNYSTVTSELPQCWNNIGQDTGAHQNNFANYNPSASSFFTSTSPSAFYSSMCYYQI